MRHLKLFESWTYNKIVNKFKVDSELYDIVIKYVYWKVKGPTTKLSNMRVNRIHYDADTLWVNYKYTLSDDDDLEFDSRFKIDDVLEFDDFVKNPMAYLDSEKYNL